MISTEEPVNALKKRKSASSILTPLLDAWVTVCERRQHYGSAQNAAERMIRLAPDHAKGYLRLFQVLVSRKQVEDAARVYREAMKMVSRWDPHYSKLAELSVQALTEYYERFRGGRLMVALPYHVLCTIFSFLPLRDRIRCTGVCRAWREFLFDWPAVWHDLDWTGPRFQYSRINQWMQAAHERATALRRVRRVQLRHFYNASHSWAPFLLLHRLRLERLEAIELVNVHVCAPEIYLVPILTSALHTLSLHHVHGVDLAMILRVISQTCPKLQCLTYKTTGIRPESPLPSIDHDLPLTQLQLSVGDNLDKEQQLLRLVSRCPELQRLGIEQADNYNLDILLAAIQASCPRLTTLCIAAKGWQFAAYAHVHTSTRRLRELVELHPVDDTGKLKYATLELQESHPVMVTSRLDWQYLSVHARDFHALSAVLQRAPALQEDQVRLPRGMLLDISPSRLKKLEFICSSHPDPTKLP